MAELFVYSLLVVLIGLAWAFRVEVLTVVAGLAYLVTLVPEMARGAWRRVRRGAGWLWRELRGLPGAAWVAWAALVLLAWWVRA